METTVINFNGFDITCITTDFVAHSSIMQAKEWEPHIMMFIKKYNSIYGIENVIDVGANFGYHTLLFSRETKGKVYAFEPQIQNFLLLRNNVNNNNLSNVDVYNFACGDEEIDVKMPIIETSMNTNMGDFTPNQTFGYNYTLVKTVLIDNMGFPQIDFIKIDVQGWEKKVLAGAINTLRNYKPVLIVEFENFQLEKTKTTCEELFQFIRDNNYHIFYLEREYPSDHVCVHNDKLDDFRMNFKDYIHPHTTDNDINHNIMFGVNEKIVFS